MRRAVIAVIAVILVNLPWANDAWVQHRIDSSGVRVQATVVKDAQRQGNDFLSYRLPRSIDPKQHLFGVQVTPSAYRQAVASGHIAARVVPGNPNDNRLDGQVTGSLVTVVAAVGDAIILLLLYVSMRRRRRWTRFKVTAAEGDVITVTTGGEQLILQLADDPDTMSAIHPTVGATVRGALYLVPRDDVVEGPPIGEITHLRGPEYRIAGRVRSVNDVRTDVLLENGFLMPVVSDEVEHHAELRGPATATGILMLASKRPR